VGIDHGIDSTSSKLIDQRVDFREVGIVVDSWRPLDCLPHDTQSNKVKAPFNEIFNIFIIQRILRIEGAVHGWYVRINFVDDIYTM